MGRRRLWSRLVQLLFLSLAHYRILQRLNDGEYWVPGRTGMIPAVLLLLEGLASCDRILVFPKFCCSSRLLSGCHSTRTRRCQNR